MENPSFVLKKIRQFRLTLVHNGSTLSRKPDPCGTPSTRKRKPEVTKPLYTPEQRVKRDSSVWTLVQGILAPVQFLVFLVSLGLVLRFFWTGEAEQTALISVVIKTIVLYIIMVTGCIWEKVVYDVYLFAEAFYWEDMVSMVVMILHTAYVAMWWHGGFTPTEQLALALAAYFTYVINAAQYILKLRRARLQAAEGSREMPLTGEMGPA
jgi:3-vinyl bacteriochlorophyllide hydratase